MIIEKGKIVIALILYLYWYMGF